MRKCGLAGAAILIALSVVPWLGTGIALAEDPPAAVQEVSLDSIGIGTQSVFGPDGVVELYFPPPAARLASPRGGFVRLFYAHSPNLGSGSSAVVAINGQPLGTIVLENGTAAGGLVEFPVTGNLFAAQGPNRVEVRFTLRSGASPPPAARDLYGRLDGQTMIHYQFALPGGGRPAGLETYPYSLLGGGAERNVAVVLPDRPDQEELGTAFRVLADVGRRAGSQRPTGRLVMRGQAAWLAAGGRPAVIVGRLEGLPSRSLLDAAGWKQTDRGLQGPDGAVLGPDAGLVATLVSPWDHRSPLVLLTGANDAGVARAAAALVGATDVPVSGPFTVVTRSEPESARTTRGPIPLNLVAPAALAPETSARYRSTMGFVAPPVDPGGGSMLQLRVPSPKGSRVTPTSVEAQLNGQRVGSAALDPAASQARELQFSFPARLLRAGTNGVALEFQLGNPGRGQDGQAGGGAEPLTGSLALPAPAAGATDLRSLPYPFLAGGDGRSTAIIATDSDAGTLDAAAQAMVALGSRLAAPPPHLSGAVGSSEGTRASDLVVVGPVPSSGQLAELASSLPTRAPSGTGSVQEDASARGRQVRVLWVGGGPETLTAAAAALADSQLRGRAVTVDGSGHLRVVALAEEVGGEPAGTAVTKILVAGGAALLVLLLVIQVMRPRTAPA